MRQAAIPYGRFYVAGYWISCLFLFEIRKILEVHMKNRKEDRMNIDIRVLGHVTGILCVRSTVSACNHKEVKANPHEKYYKAKMNYRNFT